MHIPSDGQLDEIATLIAAAPTRYSELGIEARLQVLDLYYKAEITEQLIDISTDIDSIQQWFKHSKLWDGL